LRALLSEDFARPMFSVNLQGARDKCHWVKVMVGVECNVCKHVT
jgi:hypothetical protein